MKRRAPASRSSSATLERPGVTSAGKTSEQPKYREVAIFAAIVLLFFASGLSSLVYQVVWTRMLMLVFGATSFATSTVLAVFMGGLALGSFVAGRFSDRLARPLLWYGILEAVIGVWALLTPSLFAAATPLYKLIWQHTHASLVPFSLLRFVCTGLILLVPTTCMGATLPLLSRHVTTQLKNVGSRVGTLYASNTFGAVLGGLLTGFLLLPALGLSTTILSAAAINFGLLIAVVLLDHFAGRAGQPSVAEETVAVRSKLSTPVIVALAAFAVSGGVAMAYEVCWTRTLLMVVGSSTYAFTVMLSAFLIGIFIGSVICARFIDRVKQPLLVFAILQFAVGALTFLSMRQFNYVPFWNLLMHANYWFDDNALMAIRFLLSGSVLIPITLCLGAIFPVVVKACTNDLAAVGRSVGTIYSANTLGAIAGAFLAGFVVMPLLGAEHTLFLCAVINALVGVVILCFGCGLTDRQVPPHGMRRLHLGLIAGGGALAVAVAALCAGSWDPIVLLKTQSAKRSLFNHKLEARNFEQWRAGLHKDYQLKYWADGACSNVGILYTPEHKVTALVTNGHVDASDNADMPVQSLVSGFPLLLKPNAQSMAIIGWGSGQTVGTATVFPVKSIDAVELEPNVITASKFFHHVNHNAESDPRVHIQTNDGRNFLLATDQKFDIVVSEPSNPWQAGVCNLFTEEYFKVCKQRLNKDGLLSVWLQISEVPPKDVCAVFSALRRSFPHLLAFYPRPGNLVIIAAEQPIKISMPELRRVLADSKIGAELASVGIHGTEDVLSHIAVASDGISGLAENAIANTDDKNHLEFDVGKSYESKLYLDENKQLLAAMSGSPWLQIDWGNEAPVDKARTLAGVALRLEGVKDEVRAQGWAQHSLQVLPNAFAYRILGVALADGGSYAEAEQIFSKALALDPRGSQLHLLRGTARLRLNKRDGARDDFAIALQEEPKNDYVRYMSALTYETSLLGDPYSAADLQSQESAPARKVLSLLGDLPEKTSFADDRPAVYLLTAQAKFKLGDSAGARRYLDKFLKFEPHSIPAQMLQRQL